MRYLYSTNLPERLIVLSLLLPPLRNEPAAPFGFGAFIVGRRWRNDAAFAAHAHGYGAGYDPRRMRVDIGKLSRTNVSFGVRLHWPSGLQTVELNFTCRVPGAVAIQQCPQRVYQRQAVKFGQGRLIVQGSFELLCTVQVYADEDHLTEFR